MQWWPQVGAAQYGPGKCWYENPVGNEGHWQSLHAGVCRLSRCCIRFAEPPPWGQVALLLIVDALCSVGPSSERPEYFQLPAGDGRAPRVHVRLIPWAVQHLHPGVCLCVDWPETPMGRSPFCLRLQCWSVCTGQSWAQQDDSGGDVDSEGRYRVYGITFTSPPSTWTRDVRTWSIICCGQEVRYSTDYILGIDIRLLQKVAIQDLWHNTDHYLFLGCLHGST